MISVREVTRQSRTRKNAYIRREVFFWDGTGQYSTVQYSTIELLMEDTMDGPGDTAESWLGSISEIRIDQLLAG
jgi:hypothetical protein